MVKTESAHNAVSSVIQLAGGTESRKQLEAIGNRKLLVIHQQSRKKKLRNSTITNRLEKTGENNSNNVDP